MIILIILILVLYNIDIARSEWDTPTRSMQPIYITEILLNPNYNAYILYSVRLVPFLLLVSGTLLDLPLTRMRRLLNYTALLN